MEFASAPGDQRQPGRATPTLCAAIRTGLLHWFRTARRDLPWRVNRDPYRIWLSEVMLQQTTVTAVVPYFHRFLQAFPTIADLASAEEQAVLRLWEGLGYYRRARDLHRAAQLLVERHGGTLPNDPEALSDLPGMGRYTLGAVLSQAFDRPVPILEANSLRVLCRLFGRIDDPRRGPAQRWLWSVAAELVPPEHAGDFNQALMELGALVCTPTAPQCQACPLAESCVASRLGRQEEIPAKPARPAITEVREAAVVIRRGTSVLIVQRPSTGRWANLWEFPHGPLKDHESPEEATRRLAREFTGLEISLGAELMTIRHAVTRYRITLTCFEAPWQDGEFRSDYYRTGRWLPPSELSELPVSAPQRKLIRALGVPGRQKKLF